MSEFISSANKSVSKTIDNNEQNTHIKLHSKISQCGDYMTVDEENIVVLAKSFSPQRDLESNLENEEDNEIKNEGCQFLHESEKLVVLTFDEGVNDLFYKQYYEPLLFNRKNPTGDFVSGTFYVPHPYTDYERVNNLYNRGFEIGDHSVTKHPEVDYWVNANLDLLVKELKGQKEIISKFANIPKDHIQGARIPYLQLAGNISIKAHINSGLSFDNSWTTLSFYYPYTLDYLSTQDCPIGVCPNESFKGFWIAPVINLRDQNNTNACNSPLACLLDDDLNVIYNWLVREFNRVYTSYKSPFTIMLNSAWFRTHSHSFNALQKFLDFLGGKKDVFLVSEREAIEWRKNPIKLSQYKPADKRRNAKCDRHSCPLKFNEEMRYMVTCVECPKNYPWLDNPSGN